MAAAKMQCTSLAEEIKDVNSHIYERLDKIVGRLNELHDLCLQSDDKISNLIILLEVSLQQSHSIEMDELDEPFYMILETLLLELKKLSKSKMQVYFRKVLGLLKDYDKSYELFD